MIISYFDQERDTVVPCILRGKHEWINLRLQEFVGVSCDLTKEEGYIHIAPEVLSQWQT